MKKLFRVIALGAMVLALASCGKENESGGSSSSGSSTQDWYNQGGSGENFGDYSQLKSYYSSKALNSGVSNNMVVYHIGPEFGGDNFGGVNFNLDFGFCFNLFGELKGDCDQYNQGQDLGVIVDKGEYKVVRSSTSSSVNVDVATGSSNGVFNFVNASYTRNDALFREMLNMDNRPVAKVVVSQAQVYLTDGKKVNADYIEYFYNDGSQEVKGYIVSQELPIIANPLAVTDNYDLTGVLSFSGSQTIRSVQVTIHDLQYDYMTNTYQVINIGSRSAQF